MKTNFEKIEKELINALQFPETDVLDDRIERSQRLNELQRAVALGNLEHGKTKIYFEDNKCKRVVETTVWAVTDNRIVLKRGVAIPINRIYRTI